MSRHKKLLSQGYFKALSSHEQAMGIFEETAFVLERLGEGIILEEDVEYIQFMAQVLQEELLLQELRILLK